jgi:hypothetical protein
MPMTKADAVVQRTREYAALAEAVTQTRARHHQLTEDARLLQQQLQQLQLDQERVGHQLLAAMRGDLVAAGF